MAALVQQQYHDGVGATSWAVTITSTAGNTLVVIVNGYLSEDSALALASITDSASNAGWKYSTAASNQNPPAGGSWDSGLTVYGFAAIGVCADAAAVTSVTVEMSQEVDYYMIATVLEFSGVPSSAEILGAAASSTLTTGTTTYTTPSATASGPGLAVASISSQDGDYTSATSGWSLVTTDGAVIAAYDLSASAGSVSVEVSGGSSQAVMGSAVMVIGAPASGPRLLQVGIA